MIPKAGANVSARFYWSYQFASTTYVRMWASCSGCTHKCHMVPSEPSPWNQYTHLLHFVLSLMLSTSTMSLEDRSECAISRQFKFYIWKRFPRTHFATRIKKKKTTPPTPLFAYYRSSAIVKHTTKNTQKSIEKKALHAQHSTAQHSTCWETMKDMLGIAEVAVELHEAPRIILEVLLVLYITHIRHDRIKAAVT